MIPVVYYVTMIDKFKKKCTSEIDSCNYMDQSFSTEPAYTSVTSDRENYPAYIT